MHSDVETINRLALASGTAATIHLLLITVIDYYNNIIIINNRLQMSKD